MKHIIVMWILTLLVSSVWAEIFRDDFNDGDLTGWTFVQGAEHGKIQNGELVLSSPKPVREAEVIIAVNGIISRDYEVAVSLKIGKLVRDIDINGGPAIGLRAHTDPFLEPIITPAPARGKKGFPTLLYGRSYKFFLGNQDINIQDIRRGLAATVQHMDVVKKNNEGNKVFIDVVLMDELRAFQLFDFRLRKWYRLKIIAKGNQFQCFIDDEKILDFFDDTYREGRIYLSSGLENHVHFDDFEVQYEALSVQPRRKLTTTWGEIKGDFH